MKKITGAALAALALVGAFVAIKPSLASGDNCYQISNPDSKNFCLATAKRDKNYCYQISEPNRKNMCLALSGRDKNYCYQINNADMKNQCLGQF